MHWVALVAAPDHVCCRYRLAAYRQSWAQAGHTLELQGLPDDWRGWLRSAGSWRRADGVILQRRLLPRSRIWLLRRLCRRLVFDFDDAVFLNDSYHPRGLLAPHKLRSFAATVRVADAVVAGNTYLAAQAARWTCPTRVWTVPTTLDPDRYRPARPARAGDGVELVWIGSASTLRGLERIRAVLEEIGRRCPGVRLKLVCDRFLEFAHLPVRACPWVEAEEAHALATADIGISWVPDDLWSQGKCGLKVLQYMAAGLPVIANPVGVQKTLVQHGVTGFLAKRPDEWVAAIRCLADDPELRERMGQAGRQHLIDGGFTVAAGGERWQRLLHSLRRAEQGP